MSEMLVRFKKGKTTFEVVTRDGAVSKYRDKSLKSLDDVLLSGDDIFTDIKKGKKASREQLSAAFETDDKRAILETIVLKGDVQVSANERQQKVDQRRAEIVAYIQKHFREPGRGSAIPATRIENALDKLRPRIDGDTPAHNQVKAMLSKLSDVLPMRKAEAMVSGVVSVPAQHAGAVAGVVRKHGTVTKEEYGARVRISVDVDSYNELIRDLARVTKGDYEFDIAGDEGNTTEAAAAPASGKAGKKKKGGRKK